LEQGPLVRHNAGSYRIRYLINLDTGGVANLNALDDLDPISPAEIRGWERDLDCPIPKPWDAHEEP
jgi:hypothetical protein